MLLLLVHKLFQLNHNMRRFLISLILSILLTIFLYLGMDYDGLLVKIYGFSVATVSSGSMEPNLQVGDVIIMKEFESYDVNDIVTFNSNDECLVTHRIIRKDGNNFITKGDSNNTKDTETVSIENVEGKVICNSKILGWLYKHWIIAVILIILLLILL